MKLTPKILNYLYAVSPICLAEATCVFDGIDVLPVYITSPLKAWSSQTVQEFPAPYSLAHRKICMGLSKYVRVFFIGAPLYRANQVPVCVSCDAPSCWEEHNVSRVTQLVPVKAQSLKVQRLPAGVLVKHHSGRYNINNEEATLQSWPAWISLI